MSARKEMQDGEDERSATRIGQDRRTGDYRGRGFPGDERRSPAGFHLIPSWLTTDSPLPLSSSLSAPCTYCLSFRFQPFTSVDVLLCLSVTHSLFPFLPFIVKRSVLLLPSAFDQPSTLSLFPSQLSFLFPFSRRFSFHIYLSRFLHFSRSLSCIYDSPLPHLFLSLIFYSLWQLYFSYSIVHMLSTCSNNPTFSHDAGAEVRRFSLFYLSPFFAIHCDELTDASLDN